MILGSVAQEELHHTTLPVLLVRANEPLVELGTGPYHTIQVPLDGTALAEAALSYLAHEELDLAASISVFPERAFVRFPKAAGSRGREVRRRRH